jgi:membrane-bound lytic murein transglycosylase D
MRIRVTCLSTLALMVLLLTGCASVTGTGGPASPVGKPRTQSESDPGALSEREKWSLARDAYDQALKQQERKDNEAAAYYYEVCLELLGSLDMGAIEVPTRRVLAFQKKVLASYDKFLAAVDHLPSTAGPVAVLESSGPADDSSEDEPLDLNSADRDNKPPEFQPNAPPLPDVPVTMNGLVAGQINFFMNKGRKVMVAWMERATYIFPRLRPILREEGLPEDILYLAMIESGLNTRAYSYAHAGGIWQFLTSTGRIYGLTVDRLYDERFHVEAATRAACRYLRNLYDEFGDWYLAFAAYNCGERRIEKEMIRNRTRDYWKMRRLPRQTRNYVPAYLAARTICKNPSEYGFPPLPPEVPFQCEEVWVDRAHRLDLIAQTAGHDPAVVADLNPEFRRGITPPNMKVRVRLPRKPDEGFSQRLANLPRVDVAPSKAHRVRKGETLASIARRYGTTVEAIRSLPENGRIRANRLRTGQTIWVPVWEVGTSTPPAPSTTVQTAAATADTGQRAVTTSAAPVAARDTVKDHEIVYTVHRGETLGRVAQQLGVPVSEICAQNKIADPDVIQPGTKLRIRIQEGSPTVAPSEGRMLAVREAPTPGGAPEPARPHTHRVRLGDTIWSIARAYGQDPLKIMSWNGLNRDSTIYPGQEIIVNQE